MSKKEKQISLHIDENTNTEHTLHDEASESIKRRLLNLPQQPLTSSSSKSGNKANSNNQSKENPLKNKRDSDKEKDNKSNRDRRSDRDKNHEKNKKDKPDLNKNSSNQQNSKITDPIKSKVKDQVKSQVKNQVKNSSKQVAKKGVKKVAQKGAKKAAKTAAKVAAKVAKKVAIKAAALLAKALGALVASIGLPALLIGIAVVILIVLLMTLSTLSMGTGNSVDYLGDDAVELREYIVELADGSVDMSKPEQVPYRIPEELLAAVVQLDAMLQKEDEEPEIDKMKKLLKTFADELKPEFESETFTEWTKTRTKSCEKYEEKEDEEGNKITTDKCIEWSDWKETKTEREVTRLTSIEAWNGTATFDYQEDESEWTGSSTSQTKEMAYVIEEQDFVYDFSKLDAVLNDAGYNMDDKKMFEYFYESATGLPMNYIAWLNGEAADLSGMCGADSTFVGNVTPGKGVPPQYMPYYLSAQQKYGVPWYALAAIHSIETTFSTNVNVSSAGAIGHTQFMPLTWIGWSYPGGTRLGNANIPKEVLTDPAQIKKYGGYGVDANGDGKADPWDLMDAIHTTAKYLKANGYLSNPRKAFYAYNNSNKYVNDAITLSEKFKKEATVTAPDETTDTASASTSEKTASLGVFETGTAYAETQNGLSNGFFPLPKGQYSKLVDTWGASRTYGGNRTHEGNDIMAKKGVPIYSATDGTITQKGWLELGGWRLSIKSPDGYFLYYAHLNQYAIGIEKGGTVKRGQLIGYVGDSGYGKQGTTGKFDPHLHFGIYDKNDKAINPYPYLAAWEKGAKVSTDTMPPASSGPCIGADGGSSEMPEITSGDFMKPTTGTLTSGFGNRSGGMHYGVDIAKPGSGVAVVAAADGVVSKSYFSDSYGNCVMIKHNINGVEYETVYAHMRNRAVSTGQKVKKGDFLGNQGNTGASRGQHLHFEVHKGSWTVGKTNAINPLLVIPK